MGLLSKTVFVTWDKRNCSYYKNLGYSFTTFGDSFEVKVNDLTKYSNAFVDVECNNCGKILNHMQWLNFQKYIKEDGKYYCNSCATKLYGNEKYRLSRLNNSKSFEQWCIENNRQDILDRWDYELNNQKPNEIGHSTNIKCYFKCPIKIHESELKNIKSFTSNQEGSLYCNKCNSFAQWGIDNICEDFLDKYWDWNKNIINPWDISYGNNSQKIWIKCQKKDYHGSYEIYSNDFTNKNSRCPYCINHKVHFLDSLGILYPKVITIWSDKNLQSPYEYAPTSRKQNIWWKCPNGKHNDYLRNICDSNTCNFNCPHCIQERDESILQEKVRLYLNSLGYVVLHENKCTILPKNPKTKYQLPFDNEVVELKLIIEVHGKQHYEICGFHITQSKHNNITPMEELLYIQYKDKYKKEYALLSDYDYLEIPYWTDDKEETWKELIINKINNLVLKGVI